MYIPISKKNILITISLSIIFSLFLISPVYSGGEGGEGGGDPGTTSATDTPFGLDSISSSATSVSVGDTVSISPGFIGDPTPGIIGGLVADEASSRGTPGVSVSESEDGTVSVSGDWGGGPGGGYEDFIPTDPPIYPTDPSCTSPADIVVTDMSFSRKNTPKKYLTSYDLDTGFNYIPSVLIVNAGCSDTDEGKVREDYRNQDPKGKNGTFPVRLRLDFDDDGVIDYDEVINSVGPLKAGGTTLIAFPAFRANNDGDHTAIVNADPHSMSVGCTGGWGCVNETKETNKYTLDFAISVPWVDLGSFLMKESVGCVREDPGDASLVSCYLNDRRAYKPVVRSLYRDVEKKVYESDYDYSDYVPGVYTGGPISYSDWDIGLLWDGNKIIPSTCTGNRSDFDAKWHPWALKNGFDSSGKRANVSFSKNQYDTDIDEPAADKSHTYTITCQTTGGSLVSDTHILNGTGVRVPPETIDLTPSVGNKEVKPKTVLNNYLFSVRNTGLLDVNDFTYNISIGGTDVTRGDGSPGITVLKVDNRRNIDGSIHWVAPNSETTVPIEVCITHPDMDGKKCSAGTITVTPDAIVDLPECRDGENNDDDGWIDWPDDPGCDNKDDDDETDDPSETGSVTTTGGGSGSVSISASPSLVSVGGRPNISWRIRQPEPECTIDEEGVETCEDPVVYSCKISQKIDNRSQTTWKSGLTSGGSAKPSALIRRTTFSINCGALGSDRVTIRVNLPDASVSAEPTPIRKGDPVTVTWQNDIRISSSEHSIAKCVMKPTGDFTGLDLYTDGTHTTYPENEVLYEYRCTFPNTWYANQRDGLIEDSARVRVLPDQYET